MVSPFPLPFAIGISAISALGTFLNEPLSAGWMKSSLNPSPWAWTEYEGGVGGKKAILLEILSTILVNTIFSYSSIGKMQGCLKYPTQMIFYIFKSEQNLIDLKL
jgi:hypothetical protein